MRKQYMLRLDSYICRGATISLLSLRMGHSNGDFQNRFVKYNMECYKMFYLSSLNTN